MKNEIWEFVGISFLIIGSRLTDTNYEDVHTSEQDSHFKIEIVLDILISR